MPLVKIIDGPTMILSVRLNPLLDSEDLRAGVVMVINDLTSEVMLAEKESSQAYLFNLPLYELENRFKQKMFCRVH